jgi:hypothetical protein
MSTVSPTQRLLEGDRSLSCCRGKEDYTVVEVASRHCIVLLCSLNLGNWFVSSWPTQIVASSLILLCALEFGELICGFHPAIAASRRVRCPGKCHLFHQQKEVLVRSWSLSLAGGSLKPLSWSMGTYMGWSRHGRKSGWACAWLICSPLSSSTVP